MMQTVPLRICLHIYHSSSHVSSCVTSISISLRSLLLCYSDNKWKSPSSSGADTGLLRTADSPATLD